MELQIAGIHHITAITGHASQNVGFYTHVLGMRLVKKTVNQDDVSAYHLFYGDRRGNPGTELTFFDWPQSPQAVPGAATIAPIALRVGSSPTLEWWSRRFDEVGVTHEEIAERHGRTVLAFQDPESQRIELVDDRGRVGGAPWPESPVPAEHAIKGIHDVTVNSARPEGTTTLLTEVLGFHRAATFELERGAGRLTLFETGDGGAGSQVRVVAPAEARRGFAGIGGVHHVAFRTPDEEQQRQWRDRITQAGLQVTPVIDRFYFHSIYFREPGGALFEIATDGPGFATDEPESALGERLSLPPFLEGRRQQIEAGLRPIEVPAGL
jgi:glyoxalase family protein